MDSKYYNYIIKIAEYGNISKAAQALYITQPALSKVVTKIEDEYKIKLFEKRNGKLSPTPFGKIMIESGREIINIEKKYQHEFQEINNTQKGSLSISITPTRDLYILPIVLPEFRAIYPNFDLEINEKGIGEIEDSILNNESRIGIYITQYYNKKLDYEILQDEEVVICLSSNSKYLKYTQNKSEFKFPRIDLRLLEDEIFFINNPCTAKLGNLAKIYFEEYNIKPKTMIIKNMETRLSLASIGEGIAFTYEIGSKFIKNNSKDVVFLSIGKKKRSDKFIISYLKDNSLNEPYRKFIDITKESFNK